MVRPTKASSERRKRWDTLYVTDAERASVTLAASRAGLSVSRYVLLRHAGGHIVNRTPWRQNIQLLSTVTQQLDDIARLLGAAREVDANTGGGLSQSLKIAASLLALERLIRSEVMPWQTSGQPNGSDREEENLC
jgi:hypothetical protein